MEGSIREALEGDIQPVHSEGDQPWDFFGGRRVGRRGARAAQEGQGGVPLISSAPSSLPG